MPDLSRPARSVSLLAGIVLLSAAASSAPRRADVPLSSLDLTRMKVQPGGGRGAAQTVAQANKSIDGNPIHIGGKEFTAGVGTRANSVLFVQLNGGAEHFSALVGADDNPIQAPPSASRATFRAPSRLPPTPIVFRAVGDGRVLHVSKPVSRGDAPEPFDVDLRGIRTLVLQVKQVDVVRPVAANWADARFTVTGAAPVAIDIPVEPREILTPKPGPAPRINGPSLTGVTPGPRRPLQDSRNGHRADHLWSDESAQGTHARSGVGSHSRHDRRAWALPGDVHREERGGVDVEAVHFRRRRTARAHASDGMEQLERLRPCGERFTRPGGRRRDGVEGTHRPRLDVHQPRRRLGAKRARIRSAVRGTRSVRPTARCSPTRSSRT